jgi:hypothetical protein
MPSSTGSDSRVVVVDMVNSKRKPRRGQSYQRRQLKRVAKREAKAQREALVNANLVRVAPFRSVVNSLYQVKEIKLKPNVDIYAVSLKEKHRRILDVDPRVSKVNLKRPPVDNDLIDRKYKTKCIPLERDDCVKPLMEVEVEPVKMVSIAEFGYIKTLEQIEERKRRATEEIEKLKQKEEFLKRKEAELIQKEKDLNYVLDLETPNELL